MALAAALAAAAASEAFEVNHAPSRWTSVGAERREGEPPSVTSYQWWALSAYTLSDEVADNGADHTRVGEELA